ncbi:GntR family transcriptional regulator [Tessaracoccus antarcticus]|uniref:GntR family transcriptional regulator n=1 Tax=Tessaracoccus antarcticus TaxID=2479848 RepID=A0A3M0G9C4_9ACTN|nr:GntR family transcriptional regulator [Tessaracoccus antarcticus]RMB61554.1 GntR family transcriptional regulator [Tessaracoccus antarcticus]
MAPSTLDRNSSVPLYVQIENALRSSIADGEFKPGDRIPSEVSLNDLFGCSRMTVRGVLNALVDDGLLYRVPGKGTFVTEQKISARSPAYRGIREQLEQMGFTTTTELVTRRATIPGESVRTTLRTDRSVDVHEIVRRRLVDGVPVSLHRSFVPVPLAPDLATDDVVGEQLCVILEREYGLRPARTIEQLEAVAATRQEAKLLGVAEGAPLLLLEDTISEQSGTVFEYSKILFRGDRMKLHFDYTT